MRATVQLALRLALSASLSASAAAQQGMCPQRYVTCDEPRSDVAGEGGLGSGVCVSVATDECGSTQIDFTDSLGGAVVTPVVMAAGQRVAVECRTVADMDTSGLQLSDVRLDDPEIAAAMGESDGMDSITPFLGTIETAQQLLTLFGTLGGEICVTLHDAHITTEVTQACVTAELKLSGTALGDPIDVGCWYEGLACFNATSCTECTSMADDLRASGRYDGAASCGWCAATSTCLLGGTAGPRCGDSGTAGGCDEWSWTSSPALCLAEGAEESPSGEAAHAACIAQSMLTSPVGWHGSRRPALEAGSAAEAAAPGACDSTAAVLAALIGGCLLGFLGGSCCGARVGEVMRVIGHRIFPDCVQDPYKQSSRRYAKESGGGGGGGEGPAAATATAAAAGAASGDVPRLVPPHALSVGPVQVQVAPGAAGGGGGGGGVGGGNVNLMGSAGREAP
jgi:hypothetical protein